ncbi:MAG: polysulfide reductase, partial [Gemmatimonadetes bacterium]|nr:polysulfide reductase [Gemmatimonadota bacterium]
VRWSHAERGPMKLIHWLLSLGSRDLSPEAVAFDKKAVYTITLIGIPSAFLLHGYVGFIFGSVKANPWWSSVLMPIVFLFSAIVSGIALVLLLYYLATMIRRREPDMACLNKLAEFLLYALIIDLSLETLDFIHRLYESEESIEILSELILSKLFLSLTIVQILLGTIGPMVLLA